MPRDTVARIDCGALRHNYRVACQRAGGAEVMAVVKADGYGHGIAEVAGALAAEAPRFGVAVIEEANAIRDAGLSQPVVLMQGPHSSEDLELSAEQGYEPIIHGHHQLEWLIASSACPAFWIKVNSGMNRLGFSPDELASVMARLHGAGRHPLLIGFVTHFSCADDPASSETEAQTLRFAEAVEPWPQYRRSVANSAAHFRDRQPFFELARPGIMLYGGSPVLGKTGLDLGLRPAMTLEAPLISVRTLNPGDYVGYGGTWKASKETPMGIVAIGYGDGYPRHAGTGTPAAVNGHRISLIGRVSMDMLAVDLSATPEARPGDSVELWGNTVSVDEVAHHAGTIGYELLTGITARVPRRYENITV